MTKPQSIFLPAFGKILELTTLDSFVWATLWGWGVFKDFTPTKDTVQLLNEQIDAASQAEQLEARLTQEEERLDHVKFTDEQEKTDFPYLAALVSVRLWAMAEAAAREVIVEALKKPTGPPDRSKLLKLKGPIGQFVGVDFETQAELLADALWQSPEGRFRGVERFDAVLQIIGLGGSVPSPISEILIELSEVRHCVVHRGGLIDRRFLESCPWITLKVGTLLPTSMKRYWFHRNATYWYILDLVRRWARWQNIPQLVQLADKMDSVVLQEMTTRWQNDKRIISA